MGDAEIAAYDIGGFACAPREGTEPSRFKRTSRL